MTEQERNGRAVAVGDICLSFFYLGFGLRNFPDFLSGAAKVFRLEQGPAWTDEHGLSLAGSFRASLLPDGCSTGWKRAG